MAEIKTIIYSDEIEMLKDFMDEDSGVDIDNLHLQWGDSLYSLLKSLGEIVTAPGFELQLAKDNVAPLPETPDPEISNLEVKEMIKNWEKEFPLKKDKIPKPKFNLFDICNVHDIIQIATGELKEPHAVCFILGIKYTDHDDDQKKWKYYVHVKGRAIFQWVPERCLTPTE